MRSKKFVLKGIVVVAGLILLSTSAVMAQCDPDNPPCEGDFNCDCDVDGSDATIFKSGFGRSEFNFPCPPCVEPAPVPKTGQTTAYATGDDGDLEKGVPWPYPRFTDNGDGTVTDNLTGLIWLKDANCFGSRTWSQALSDCNGLASGQCGLTDGSNAGDWRLPNRFELESLLDLENYNPPLPSGHPFQNVQTFIYWSSTTHASYTPAAWCVLMITGRVADYDKTNSAIYVWPVRGGH